jgi:hypothetical protein
VIGPKIPNNFIINVIVGPIKEIREDEFIGIHTESQQTALINRVKISDLPNFSRTLN